MVNSSSNISMLFLSSTLFSCYLCFFGLSIAWISNFAVKCLPRTFPAPWLKSFSSNIKPLRHNEFQVNLDINDMLNSIESGVLPKLFSHASFRPGQREVLAKLLQQESCLAIFPTGFGKSLLYMLPSRLWWNHNCRVSLACWCEIR